MPLALSDLLCGEDADGALSAANAGPEDHRASAPSFPDDSDESIAELLGGAAVYSPGSAYSSRLRSLSLDPSARADCAGWILKVNEYFCFQPLTAYLAVNYLDRFLAAHHLREAKGWAMQLLSVACLSLAAKMEETLVPSLLDLQVEGTARFIFEPHTVCKMELLVLTALKWRLRSLTPFTFIDFFACKVDPSGTYSRYLVSCANKIILATINDIEFLDHCPSSMAAAALICAVEETPGLAPIDSKSAMAWCIGLTKEGIANCYRLMQEIVMENKRRNPPVILPQLRVTTLDNMDSEASSSSSSNPPNKRRKLNNHLWVDDHKGDHVI
ncbi:cyclin-D2-1 [Iris pallida]|uniref:Cyclin-D2-1 n=1 Tax=Iris pallida TaxID=29817 RepID=A0AAX6FMV7_IRIPA|nr:cyclin-D2-1 [Iris pallida]KAJ6833655.1 cyclin-D2-1 [Iris pallida]